MNEKKSSVRVWWLAIPGGVMMLALVIGALISTSFLNPRNLGVIFRQGGPTLLIGAAIAIPFSRGHVDLSVLGVACFTGMVSTMIANAAYLHPAAMILIAICFGAAIGAINGLIGMIFRRKNVLLTAAATACIGAFYRYIAYAVSNGYPVQPSGSNRVYPSVALMFLLPLVIIAGIFALISFTGGGRRAFNGIYEKDAERSGNTIVPFLFSGILAGLAGGLMVVRLNIAQPAMFGFNPSYVLLLALAGIAIPNAKKSKIGAFLGFASVILAAVTVAIIQNCLNLCGVDSFAQNIICAVLGIVFIILNAIFGSKAARSLAAPAAEAKPIFTPAPAYEPAPVFTPEPAPVFDERPTPGIRVYYNEPAPAAPAADDPFAALSELARKYESGEITKEEYDRIKGDIIAKL
ncbi:MAG: hypothetical protein IJA26_05535 [Clostridia bacterium]|nr:hypothetical protein [Clostridia bacterium]